MLFWHFELFLKCEFLYMLLTHRYPTTVTKTNLAQAIIQAFPSLRSDGPLGYVSVNILCITVHFAKYKICLI